MTIEEISNSLPNGFHDSEICSIHLDYEKAEATFLIDIDLWSPSVEKEESIRQGVLKLKELLYFVIESPPVSLLKDDTFNKGKLWVTSDSSDFSQLKEGPQLPEPLPDGSFRRWFFLSSHNCFMYVAAMDASFQWKED